MIDLATHRNSHCAQKWRPRFETRIFCQRRSIGKPVSTRTSSTSILRRKIGRLCGYGEALELAGSRQKSLSRRGPAATDAPLLFHIVAAEYFRRRQRLPVLVDDKLIFDTWNRYIRPLEPLRQDNRPFESISAGPKDCCQRPTRNLPVAPPSFFPTRSRGPEFSEASTKVDNRSARRRKPSRPPKVILDINPSARSSPFTM